MWITQSGAYRNFISNLETLNETLNQISQQVSSGKKLNDLHDSPAGSAELLALTDLASEIDQFRSSTGTVLYYLQTADSVLNEVHNLITSIYAKGSQAATGTVGEDVRSTLATEIRSLRDEILSLANTQTKGRYIFAGSMVASAPFAIAGDSVSYQGDADINRIFVDQGTEVQPGVSGSEAFNAAFAAIESLLSAIDANDISAIQSSLGQFAAALSASGQARAKLGANLNLLVNVQTRLNARETSLKEHRSRIEDTDMASAIIQLNQAQTALRTALSAAGSILPQRNLFDILG